jgi:uncharacterized protein (DUF302 family)
MAAFERATVGLFVWWSAKVSLEDNPARTTKISRFDVMETVERLESGLRARGMKVLDRIDHSGLAARDGFRLRPTQSLLIDGAGGTPMKLVVWQARDGATMVSLDAHWERSAPLGLNLSGLLQALEPEAPEVTLG